MNRYEGMFLMDSRLFPKGWEEAVTVVQSILEKYGAKLLKAGRWDERKLAFEIEKQKRGLYVLAYFEGPVGCIPGIERECQLSEPVLRVLTLRFEGEVPETIGAPVPPPEVEAVKVRAPGPAAEAIPELAEIEGSGPVDWEEEA